MHREVPIGALLALALAAPAAAAPQLVAIGTFPEPTDVAAPPGDAGRVFVTERAGSLRLVKDGAVVAQPFLDLTSIVERGGEEQGLLSVAFAPDHASSGRFFVYLTATSAAALSATSGEIQVREYRRSASDPDRADPGSARVLLAIRHDDYQNHNGGQLQFGPDGKLWLGTGDGGGANDPGDHAQDTGSLLGKLLRLDVSQAAPKPEMVAVGLRNPWRFSFDRATRELVIGDVGQDAVEEVDVAPPPAWGLGANYGWPCSEGTRENTDIAPQCDPQGAVPPRFERAHAADVCSITGGYVARDPGLPTLAGRYVYGDFCGSSLRSVNLSAPADDRAEQLPVDELSSLGEDACGRLLAASLTGPVYRIVDGQPSPCTSAPPTGTPPGGLPADQRAPFLSLRALRIRRGRVRVRLRADEACRVTVGGRLRRVGRLRDVDRALGAGTRTTVTLRLSKRGTRALRRALRRHTAVRASLRSQVADAAGNLRTQTFARRLRG